MKLKKGIGSLLVFMLLAALLVPSSAMAADRSTTAQIPVTVNVAEGTPKGTEFKVTLAPNDDSYPMPQEKEMIAAASVSEDQDESFSASFGPITYTKPGYYYYTITQTGDDVEGVEYDMTTYTVMVVVENQDDAAGNDLGLKASVSVWEGTEANKPAADKKLADITYDNGYEKTVPTTEPTTEPGKSTDNTGTTKKSKSTKTGDNSNVLFWTAIAVIAAAACIMLILADKKKRAIKK